MNIETKKEALIKAEKRVVELKKELRQALEQELSALEEAPVKQSTGRKTTTKKKTAKKKTARKNTPKKLRADYVCKFIAESEPMKKADLVKAIKGQYPNNDHSNIEEILTAYTQTKDGKVVLN